MTSEAMVVEIADVPREDAEIPAEVREVQEDDGGDLAQHENEGD